VRAGCRRHATVSVGAFVAATILAARAFVATIILAARAFVAVLSNLLSQCCGLSMPLALVLETDIAKPGTPSSTQER